MSRGRNWGQPGMFQNLKVGGHAWNTLARRQKAVYEVADEAVRS